MAISNFTLNRMVEEYKERLEGAKISKIVKITNFDYSFLLFSKTQESLIISLEPINPYFLIADSYFKMLDDGNGFVQSLRKYFDNGTIVSIKKETNDRIIVFTIKKLTQSYQSIQNKLVVELIPHNTNAIIIDENNVIIDAIKKTALDDPKPIFKGIRYEVNNSLDKTISYNDNLESLKNKIGRNLYLDIEQRVNEGEDLKKIISSIFESTKYYRFKNDVLSIPLKYQKSEEISLKDLPKVYEEKNQEKYMKDHFYTAFHLVEHKLKGLRNKLINLQKDFSKNELRKDYIEIGNLLFMNQDKYTKGMTSITIEGKEIKLDEKINLAQNAQKYFKFYQKSKTALDQLKIQENLTKEKIDYFEKIQSQINFAVSSDMEDIIQELKNDGYIKSQVSKNKNKNKKTAPKVYHPHMIKTEDGYKIGFGLSSFQNDYLTFTLSDKDDYFLHIKDSHGPHVVIFSSSPNKEAIQLAAEIAIYLADKEAGEVYLCDRKDVKKIPGKLGKVTMKNYQTITINSISKKTKEIILENLKK